MNILREKQKLQPMGNYMGGGGSTDSGGSRTQTQITELPEWAKPYAKETLAKASALTDTSQNPYQTYDQPRIAGFAPMQQQAMQGAQTMAPSEQVGFGSNLAGIAGLGALNTQYNPMMARSRDFNTYAANQYMNPYMQNVVDVQQREAQRQADIAGTQRQAQATQAGAFGGSRDAIMRAEAARNLALQKGDIQAQGLNQAFQQAQAQFNADQARRLQAQQLTEQSRQYGAGLGMQGLQTGLQAAGQLGNLGAQQFQQAMDINKLQSAYGGMQQAQQQQGLDLAYQNFLNQQNYPYKQLGFMSDILRGTPTGSSTTTYMYGQPGSTLGQIAGIGTGLYGLSKFMAEGGEVNGYAGGGQIDSEQNIESIVSKLSDQQLAQALQAAQQRGDVDQIDAIQKEQAMRASERVGVASAITPEMADRMTQMARGGIVAFGGDEAKNDPQSGQAVTDKEEATSYAGNLFKGISDVWDNLSKRQEIQQQMRKNEPGFFESLTPSERNARMEKNKELAAQMDALRGVKKPEQAKAEQKAKETQQKELEDFDAATAAYELERQSKGKKVDLYGDKGAPAAAPAAAPKSITSALPKVLDKPVKEVAQSAGVPEKSIRDEAMEIYKEFRGMSEQDLKGLNDLVEQQKDKASKIKEKGLAGALMQFGFGMAQKAAEPARPGENKRGVAGLLSSAASASPILAQAATENERLQQAADENYMKLKMDQTRYQVALNKGDMAAATALAAQIRQGNMQQKQLDATIDYHNKQLALEQQKLGIMAQHYGQSNVTPIQKIADDLQRQGFQGTREQALQRASQIAGYSFKTEASQNARLAEELRKIDDKYQMLSFMPKDSDFAKKLAADRDTRRKEAYRLYGGGMEAAAPEQGQSLASKGFKLLGTE